MPSICLYFKVHQPFRMKQYHRNDIDVIHSYDDAEADEISINTIADQSYLPANKIIASLIDAHKGKFKVSFSISGTTLDLLQRYRPDVISSFKSLTNTGRVDILAETYYHSLSYLHSRKEFKRQIEKHSHAVKNIFGVTPTVFRNTELIYNNELAKFIADLGYEGLLCEGVSRILGSRSSNHVYAAPDNSDFGLLLRNPGLSDDIAFRFDDASWSEHPLTTIKFAEWIHSHPKDTDVINLFMDYETFGIYKKKESGIFDFLNFLPEAVLQNTDYVFNTPTEVLKEHYPKDVYHIDKTISWEDKTSTSCVWCENVMQNNTIKKIYSIENIVLNNGCPKAIDIWGKLQAADYFYYMAKDDQAGRNRKYLNPFETPEKAFENYTNIVNDFELTLIKNLLSKTKRQPVAEIMELY